MTIEFRCPTCSKLLHTADGTSGRKAVCPQCKTQLTVPEQSAPQEPIDVNPEDSGPPEAQEPPQIVTGVQPPNFGSQYGSSAGQQAGPQQWSANPYQATGTDSGYGAGYDNTGPVVLDLGQVLNHSWQIFSNQMGICLGAGLLGWVVMTMVNFGLMFGQGVVVSILGNINRDLAGIAAVVVGLMSFALQMLVTYWIMSGQAIVFLRIVRNERADLGEIFSGGKFVLPVFLASLMVGLATMFGYLLCIVPGVILALMFSQFLYLIVDRNLSATDSLSQSTELVQGNKLNIFVIWLIMSVIMVLAMFTCIGFFFVVPYAWLVTAVIYTQLTRTAPPLAMSHPAAHAGQPYTPPQ